MSNLSGSNMRPPVSLVISRDDSMIVIELN